MAAKKPTKAEQLWTPQHQGSAGLAVLAGRRLDRTLDRASRTDVSVGLGFYHDKGWGRAADIVGAHMGGQREHGAAVLSAWSNGVGHMRNVMAGVQATMGPKEGGLRHGMESAAELGRLHTEGATGEQRAAAWKEHVVPGSAIDSLAGSRAGVRGTLKGFHLLAHGAKSADPLGELGALKQHEFGRAITDRTGIPVDKHMGAIMLGDHEMGYDQTSDALKLDDPRSYRHAKGAVEGAHNRLMNELSSAKSKRIPAGHPIREAHEAGHEIRPSDTQSMLWFSGRGDRPSDKTEKAESTRASNIASRFPSVGPDALRNLGIQFKV